MVLTPLLTAQGIKVVAQEAVVPELLTVAAV